MTKRRITESQLDQITDDLVAVSTNAARKLREARGEDPDPPRTSPDISDLLRKNLRDGLAETFDVVPDPDPEETQ